MHPYDVIAQLSTTSGAGAARDYVPGAGMVLVDEARAHVLEEERRALEERDLAVNTTMAHCCAPTGTSCCAVAAESERSTAATARRHMLQGGGMAASQRKVMLRKAQSIDDTPVLTLLKSYCI
jgi:hypothetical protein